jgi:hypothetical protein
VPARLAAVDPSDLEMQRQALFAGQSRIQVIADAACSIVHIECVACLGPVFLLRSVCRSPAIHHVRTAPVSASRAIVCGLYEGSPIGSVKRKIAPRGWFAAADSRPP